METNEEVETAIHKIRKQALLLFAAAGVLLIFGIGAFVYTFINNSSEVIAVASAQKTRDAETDTVTIRSTYGFDITYNHVLDDAQANTHKDVRKVKETLPDEGPVKWKERDYDYVSIRPDFRLFKDYTVDDRSSMTVNTPANTGFTEYMQGQADKKKISLVDRILDQFAPSSGSIEGFSDKVKLLSREDVTINDIKYRVGTYEHTINRASVFTGGLESYKYQDRTYITVQNGLVYDIDMSFIQQGITDQSEARYMSYLASINYYTPDSSVISAINSDGDLADVSSTLNKTASGKKLASSLANLFNNKTYAQDATTDITNQVAINEPNTVRILAAYCATFTITIESSGGSSEIPLSCTGGQGSGVIVNSEGYIVTNGHVAALSPVSILADSVSFGDTLVISEVLKAMRPSASAGDLASWAAKVTSNTELQTELYTFVKYYNDEYTITNVVDSKAYRVQLSHNVAKFKTSALNGLTEANDLFETNDKGVVSASFVTSDFNASDPHVNGTQKSVYTASDVAIIKLDKGNYQSAILGDIDTLESGNSIAIIGYPGLIEKSGLSDTSEILPTVTKGVVSSIRNDSGGSNKLVQTDATIDHGNSGGPMFNASGEVIGVATYGVSSEAGAQFNYARDIQDAIRLLDKESIEYNKPNEINTIWEEALVNYRDAYFTDAIKGFERVLELNSNHPTAQIYIDRSKVHQENGDEVAKISAVFVPVAIGFTALGVGGGGAGFILHEKHRKRLKKHLAGIGINGQPVQMSQPQSNVVGRQVVQPQQPQPQSQTQPQPQQPQEAVTQPINTNQTIPTPPQSQIQPQGAVPQQAPPENGNETTNNSQ